jgi:nucleoside-diphosphate-sugar epimerase
MESEKALNEDFNISTSESTTVLQLAEIIWKKINQDKPFEFISDEPFKYDVQKRIPSVEKAKDLLGFSAETKLEKILDEVIPWIIEQVKIGGI